MTKNRDLVQEAVRLFEADTKRQPYAARCDKFLVSPVNAREQLTAFLRGAKQELLIYDNRISDRAMIRLLGQQARAGVKIRIVGGMVSKNAGLDVRKLAQIRLHTRTIVRDRRLVFLGSQSLRELELDARREIGIIVRDAKIVNSLLKIFEEDWSAASGVRQEEPETHGVPTPMAKAVTKAADRVVKQLPPVVPAVEQAVQQIVGDTDVILDADEVDAAVKDAVKEAIKGVVRDVVDDMVEQH